MPKIIPTTNRSPTITNPIGMSIEPRRKLKLAGVANIRQFKIKNELIKNVTMTKSPALKPIAILLDTRPQRGTRTRLSWAPRLPLERDDAAKSLDGESVDRWGRPCGLSHLASQTCRQAANSEGRI